MVGILRAGIGCLAVFVLIVPTAVGFGGRSSGGQVKPSASYYVPYSYPFAYYYVQPIPYYCPPSAPQIVPVPDAPDRPIPAPPRQTSEPPLNQPPPPVPAPPMKATGPLQSPIIITTRSVGAFTSGSTPIPKDRCRVGFWNLSGRDVTLTIDNRAMTLAKDRALTIDLDRQFAWQADQQPQHVERIPEGQTTHEIVIR